MSRKNQLCGGLATLAFFLCLDSGRVLWSQQTPRQTTLGLRAADGMEVTLWAAEPDVINPTNIDIDTRGRVWVLEGVNYRRTLPGMLGKDDRPAGDRIVILEDTDGDGKSDKTKVFAQDLSLRTPLGIAVLGDKVFVSQSPDLIVFTKDEQDSIVKKEVLLTGWRGIDHDHGLHAVVFGPDGRYYFNSGDQGFDVTDKSGKRFVSSRNGPYYAGTALRMNADGTDFTVLGHNFRNPYELAVDSFGNIWQTDNDDDGNAWVRLNYVLEGGNFGYWGPGGKSWRVDRGSHFHSELPGVVPNIQRLGAGAPCGLIVYEGKLLPAKYRGHLLHAEAGGRTINSYLLQPEGAGYSVKVEAIVAAADPWFRPSDVCVAPDGAVFISDWYDPGVGGHRVVDVKRGRIYRLAPAGNKPQKIPVDLTTPAGLAEAFGSPAQSVRYLAYSAVKQQGEKALAVLQSLSKSSDPIVRARALWLLGGSPGEGEGAIRAALEDIDSNFRMLALRILRRYGAELSGALRTLARDPSPQVRREVAVALQHLPPEQSLDALVALCRKYDGKDRWMLEAIGIAARGKENALYARLQEMFPGKWNSRLGNLLWVLRPTQALPNLISLFKDDSLPVEERMEALDALSAQAQAEAGLAVAEFVQTAEQPKELVEKSFARLAQRLYSEWVDLRKNSSVMAAVKKSLKSPALQARALELAGDLEDAELGAELLALARSEAGVEEARVQAIEALGRTRNEAYLAELEPMVQSGAVKLRVAAVRAIGNIKPKSLEAQMKKLLLSQGPNEVRTEAVRVLGRADSGCAILLDLEQAGQLPSELRNVASGVTNGSPSVAIRSRAKRLLPPAVSKNRRPLPPVRELLAREGDVERGRKLFNAVSGPKCSSCHSLDESKKSVGPNLSKIGDKLGKEALFDSILNPSAGIAPEYYVWRLQTKTEGIVVGILAEDIPQRVTVLTDATSELRFKPSEIRSRRRSHLSLMPEDLANTMTEQQMVDLIAFLGTLKKETKPTSVSSTR
ncbi:MAG: c-type cytochrome [Acidobacteria bacterium]|nr:c-type cytochrome [Acidobacteriota bacterium]MCI0722464.1 c-type cytochrome [Acidobacteriota bacterium]